MLQSRGAVDGEFVLVEMELKRVVLDIKDSVVGPETGVVEGAALLGSGVVGHGLEWVSTSQDSLQNAT